MKIYGKPLPPPEPGTFLHSIDEAARRGKEKAVKEGGHLYAVAVRYSPVYRPRKRLADTVEVRAPNASAARERAVWVCEYELGRKGVTVTSCRRKS